MQQCWVFLLFFAVRGTSYRPAMPHQTESRSAAAKRHKPATEESSSPAKRRRVARSRDLNNSATSLEAATLSGDKGQTIGAGVNQIKISVKEEVEGQDTPRTSRSRTEKDSVEVTTVEAKSVISSNRNTRVKKVKAVLVKEEEEIDVVESPQRPGRTKKVELSTLEQQREEETPRPPVKSRKPKKTEIFVQAKEEVGEEAEQAPKKVKKRRKTKEEKEAEAMPLTARTTGLRMFIGAHVSCAKGIRLLFDHAGEMLTILYNRCTKLCYKRGPHWVCDRSFS